MVWGPTESALTGTLQHTSNRDFELCFLRGTSEGLSVEDKNNNNRRFDISDNGTCKEEINSQIILEVNLFLS